MTGPLYTIPLADCLDAGSTGGKALNLGKLLRAGFSVPPGFAVTTEAFRLAEEVSGKISKEIAEAVTLAYRELGSPPVAVRSSATTEDLSEASMAGQYESFLDIEGEEALLGAIEHCWSSLRNPRTQAYFEGQNRDGSGAAMAVVVQKLVPAEISGVLFTSNPIDGSAPEMMINASYGLGEAVVSGTVHPDTFVFDRTKGELKQISIGSKESTLTAGQREFRPTPAHLRPQACLQSTQLTELWSLGRKIEQYFDTAQDVEWAIYNGQIYILQSRPITTGKGHSPADLLHSIRRQLRTQQMSPGSGWALHNIAETLPHPTPLTWAAVRFLMSGRGGLGSMYRMAGFQPSPDLQEQGFLDLIGGRIYMNLTRAPEMFFEGFPFRYDPDLLQSDPEAVQKAPTLPHGPLLSRYRTAGKIAGTTHRLREVSENFSRKLEVEIIPEFLLYVRREKARDLSVLSAAEWIELWRNRRDTVLGKFAAHFMLPSLIAGMATEDLKAFCAEHFWEDDPAILANILSLAEEPDRSLQAAEGLYQLDRGETSIDNWLEKFGHRAPGEFDLGTPRWRENPEAARTMAAHTRNGESPLGLHQKRFQEARGRFNLLSVGLPPSDRSLFTKHVDTSRRYLPYRENGKYYLMLGYDLLRDMALDAGKRTGYGSDVFLLDEETLFSALSGNPVPPQSLEAARRLRRMEARIQLPRVITPEEIDRLGKPVSFKDGNQFTGLPIANGVATGPVEVVLSPLDAEGLKPGCILVCPSTDPNWTPLFSNAAGLVLERGGTLSHGAVVAREMGLAAIVLDGATQLFKNGQILSLDGDSGTIFRGNSNAPDSNPTEEIPARISHQLIPPPPGDRERTSGKCRNFFLLFWGAYLLAAFFLPPSWIHDPSLRFLDAFLWPLVGSFGKPTAVVAIAVALALFNVAGQRWLTDNRRLLVAKERGEKLRREAAKFPENSAAARNRTVLASSVTTRIMLASMVPVAVILGPMVMLFSWLPKRVDPASWNASPGATVFVTATVDGDYTGPVTLKADPSFVLAEYSPATQTNPPIRATLEKLRTKWESSLGPSEQNTLADPQQITRRRMLEDLNLYLKGKVPARELAWNLESGSGPGRYLISVFTGEPSSLSSESLRTHAVLGDTFPPEIFEPTSENKIQEQIVRSNKPEAKIQSLRISYKEKRNLREKHFWQPFIQWGHPWEASWLFTYVAAYMAGMLLFRSLIRIP